MKRVATACLAAATALAIGAPASALVVKTWNGPGTPQNVNNTPPADDPGWANLPNNDSVRTGLYLGDQWVISAVHAGQGNLELSGGSFPIVADSTVTLTNPHSFGGQALSDSLSDVYLYRIGVDETTGLTPEELDSAIRRIAIADRLPDTDDVVTMIGRGAQRITRSSDSNGQYHWTAGGTPVTNTEVAAEHGFLTDTFRQWRWGTNKLTNPSGISGNPIRSGDQFVINVNTQGSTQVRQTIGFSTRFDRGLTDSGLPLADGSTPDEAQGAPGDSGGPVFWKDDDEWVLAGVMHAIYQKNNQAGNEAWFGNHTGISDLSFEHYHDQIEAIRSEVLYSVDGDIDLDGIATGAIVGNDATGDLGILVDNWQRTFASAGRESWIAGDLNQDARVNLADFVLMRSALDGSISTTAFASALASAIPEPSSAVLVSLAVAAGLPRRRLPRVG